jgi:hypothetical protein
MSVQLRHYIFFNLCFRFGNVLQPYKAARNVDVTILCLLIMNVSYVSICLNCIAKNHDSLALQLAKDVSIINQ